MYNVKPNLIIGFHGCDATTRDKLLNHPDKIEISERPYDWLGHGAYFWENNPDRALQWAKDKHKRGEIEKPAIIGAVLNLGYCFDLLETRHINLLKDYHALLVQNYVALDREIPQNKDIPQDIHKDKILRYLDCAVIEFMHREIANEIKSGNNSFRKFDSVRGMFTEGGPAFEGAGIMQKNHIQLCIRNLNCIKGFFLPRKEIEF